MRKPALYISENKDADQLRGNREADQRLFFTTRIVQSLYFLNPKCQASSHLLCLYSPVCVGPGRKPLRPVFSQRGSILRQAESLIIPLLVIARLDNCRRNFQMTSMSTLFDVMLHPDNSGDVYILWKDDIYFF